MNKVNTIIAVAIMLLSGAAVLGLCSDRVNADYTTDLLGWWELDESSWGTVEDSSGNNRDGSASGATPTTSSMVGSHAGSFDGTNDYLYFSPTGLAPTDEITICAWINPDTAGNHENIVSKMYDSGGYNCPYYSYSLKIQSDLRISFSIGINGDDCDLSTSTNAVSLNGGW